MDLTAHSRRMEFRRFYVWDLVVRHFHWVNAGSIATLVLTGFLIGSPPAILSELDASSQYWFGTIRFLHFSAGYILIFNLVLRIYWAFRGSEHAHWKNFVPTTEAKLDEMKSVLKTDVLQTHLEGEVTLGHNALAGLVYLILGVMILLQTITGFGLYEQMSGAIFPWFFGWVVPFFGTDATVKNLHHYMMWFFVIFTMVHIYIASYHDYVEGTGVLSSIFSGWKFEKKSDAGKH